MIHLRAILRWTCPIAILGLATLPGAAQHNTRPGRPGGPHIAPAVGASNNRPAYMQQSNYPYHPYARPVYTPHPSYQYHPNARPAANVHSNYLPHVAVPYRQVTNNSVAARPAYTPPAINSYNLANPYGGNLYAASLSGMAFNQSPSSSIIAAVTNSPYINQMQQGFLPGSNIVNPFILPSPYMSPFMNPAMAMNPYMNSMMSMNPMMSMYNYNPMMSMSMNPMMSMSMNPMMSMYNPMTNPMMSNPFMNPMSVYSSMMSNPFMNSMSMNNPMMYSAGMMNPMLMSGAFGGLNMRFNPNLGIMGQAGLFGRGF